MKIVNFLITIILIVGLILNSAEPAPSQSGNQSDITIINPNESPSQQMGNQSDITGSNVQEIKPQDKPSERRGTDYNDDERQEIDRSEFERSFQKADFDSAIEQFEELQAVQFSNYLNVELFGQAPSFSKIAPTLYNLFKTTGKKAALIYVSSLADNLEILPIFPQPPTTATATGKQESDRPTRHIILHVNPKSLQSVIQKFRDEITDPKKRRSSDYIEPAKQLYQWIIAPLEAELKANQIDILIFTMDRGLRSIPLAALHDGKEFLIEKYSIAIVPSFGLTDTRYVDIRNLPILAMGASKFRDLPSLPGVPLELQTVLKEMGRGKSYLNEQFTLKNFKAINQKQHFGIIHLATHAQFQPGELSKSYIQFWRDKLSLDKLRPLAKELEWNTADVPPLEMLVLSACKTAVGDEKTELGFAGLAVQAGVKTAIASLWYVSDAGSLGLMSEFYKQLKTTPIKSQALRQAQLAMLRGQVRIENSQLRLSDGEVVPLPPEVARAGNNNLSHPYFWSAYLLIGNWN